MGERISRRTPGEGEPRPRVNPSEVNRIFELRRRDREQERARAGKPDTRRGPFRG